MNEIECPICSNNHCSVEDIIIDPKLGDHLFNRGCKIAFSASCESDQHLFMVFIGNHKGMILTETWPIWNEVGVPLKKEDYV